jgi:pyruvate-formate lyase-activating enzyme
MPVADLRRIERTLSEIPFPKKFAVELCAECNLACSMCHHPDMRRPKGTMPMALWERCADQVAAVSPGTEVWFSFCGEPLLEPDLLLAMIRYGKEAGLRSINLNSNGQLLVPDLARALLGSGVDLMVFGIDGFSAPVYEQVRCGGDRDLVYRNVEFLLVERARLGTGPEIQVQFIEMPVNQGEMDAFATHWLARGATVKLRNQLSWGGQRRADLTATPPDRIPCPWALTMMHVFWDGRVPRCPGDTEGEEGSGNAWHAPLADLWAALGPYRAKHLAHRFDELPERCLTCTDWATGAAKRVKPRALPVI